MDIGSVLSYAQIALSVLLVALILLQQTGASVGGAFGGNDNWSAAFHTRRGSEKFLFYATIIVAGFFALTAFLALVL